jgi:hypothetical protein
MTEQTKPAQSVIERGIDEIGARAKAAALQLARATTSAKNRALLSAADGIEAAASDLIEANQADLVQAEAEDISGALLTASPGHGRRAPPGCRIGRPRWRGHRWVYPT